MKSKRRLRDAPVVQYMIIITGIFSLAYCIHSFIEPAHLVMGGATGLGIVGQAVAMKLFGVSYPLWASNIVINTPLFIMAFIVFGKKFIWKSLLGTAGLSAALYVCSFLPRIHTGVYPMGNDLLLAAVFGGAMDGFGIGLVLSRGATTGGSDIAAMLIHHYKKHLPIARIILMANAVIIVMGAFAYGPRTAMYAIICEYISSRVVAALLEGLSYAKAAFIISDSGEEIGQRILHEMQRGGTALMGKGLYTGDQKNVVMCVVSSKEIVRLKQIAKEEDEHAFVIVTDVREVLGEGFRAEL